MTNKPFFNGTFEVKNGKLDFVCNTQGVSFSEVYDGLTKLRDEIERQMANRKMCPYYEPELSEFSLPVNRGHFPRDGKDGEPTNVTQ